MNLFINVLYDSAIFFCKGLVKHGDIRREIMVMYGALQTSQHSHPLEYKQKPIISYYYRVIENLIISANIILSVKVLQPHLLPWKPENVMAYFNNQHLQRPDLPCHTIFYHEYEHNIKPITLILLNGQSAIQWTYFHYF